MNVVGRPLLIVLTILLGALGTAAGLIWLERRLLALWQDRLGPNRVGPLGLLQVAADLVKILFKEDWIPPFAERGLFLLAPAVILVTTLLSFALVPIAPGFGVVDLNVGLLLLLGFTGLGAYSVALAGIGSGSKYSLLGGVRALAQTLAYEAFLGLALAGVAMMAGSFRLEDIVAAQSRIPFVVKQFPGFLLFLIAGVAWTHRLPLDLPEADSELVAGFHAEYSGMKFGMFFVGEYLGVTLVSVLAAILYCGGWLGPVLPPVVWLLLKTLAFICLFVLLRAALPRPRFDQFLRLAWKVLLPLALISLWLSALLVLHPWRR